MDYVCKDCIFYKLCGNDSKTVPCPNKKTSKDVAKEIQDYDDSKKEKRRVRLWMRRKKK